MKKSVLFLCTGNSCRSQMAEGLVNHDLGDLWQTYSAGTEPSGYVHPMAVQVMAEIGIDISSNQSKSVIIMKDMDFDRVVTVCDHAAQNCPVWLGKEITTHLGFPDPAEAEGTDEDRLCMFRKVRDGLREKVIANLTRHSSGVEVHLDATSNLSE